MEIHCVIKEKSRIPQFKAVVKGLGEHGRKCLNICIMENPVCDQAIQYTSHSITIIESSGDYA